MGITKGSDFVEDLPVKEDGLSPELLKVFDQAGKREEKAETTAAVLSAVASIFPVAACAVYYFRYLRGFGAVTQIYIMALLSLPLLLIWGSEFWGNFSGKFGLYVLGIAGLGFGRNVDVDQESPPFLVWLMGWVLLILVMWGGYNYALTLSS